MYRLLLGCLSLLGLAAVTWAADPITNVTQAGPDYLVQGEYLALGESVAVRAAQIMALGEGRFRLSLLNGGLPGQGWDGEAPVRLDGTWDERVVRFAGPNNAALTWSEGVITGTDDQGQPVDLSRIKRVSPTMDRQAPEGAIILFDGTGTDHWANGRMDDDGLLPALSGPLSREAWADFELHLEFRNPFMPTGRGAARSNSGIYLQRRYELQICDSFGDFDAGPGSGNVCGELYRSVAPLTNACLPPLTWQTYDIIFHGARYSEDGQTKISPARLTARLNGVLIHDNIVVPDKTGAGQPEGAQPLPLYLQDHGSPIHFRHVWLKPLAPLPLPAEEAAAP